VKSFVAALLVALFGFGATVAWAHGDAASRGVDAGTRASPVMSSPAEPPAAQAKPGAARPVPSPKRSAKPARGAAPAPVFCACRPRDDHA
jgi:hypothetical protein